MSRSALVYIAIGFCAIAALVLVLRSGSQVADDGPLAHDPATMQAMLDGSMKKLRFHAAAQPVPDVTYLTADAAEQSLAAYEGKYVLVNFWATWCAPCRKEMPMLAALQSEFSSDRFEVVTIATGRNPPPAMKAFFHEIGVTNLPLHRDPKQGLARAMGVAGLPVTVLIDPQGREIARMLGDAEWDSDSARAMLEKLLETTSP